MGDARELWQRMNSRLKIEKDGGNVKSCSTMENSTAVLPVKHKIIT